MSQTAKPSKKVSKLTLRILMGLGGALAVVFVVGWMTWMFGSVRGEELCPQTFARRSFHYIEVPLVRLQVRKVVRKDTTGRTEDWLHTEKIVPKTTQGNAIWHIIRASHGMNSSKGDAQILVNYFDAEDAKGNPIWLTWSSDHPKLAQVLWPAVSQLAVEGLYIYIPELIDLAKTAKDAGKFSTDVSQAVAGTFHQAGLRCQQVGNHETAVHYFDRAIAVQPNDREFLEARAKSHEELGQTEQAKKDRDALSKLKPAGESSPPRDGG